MLPKWLYKWVDYNYLFKALVTYIYDDSNRIVIMICCYIIIIIAFHAIQLAPTKQDKEKVGRNVVEVITPKHMNKFNKIAEENPDGFMVGNQLTLADLHIFNLVCTPGTVSHHFECSYFTNSGILEFSDGKPVKHINVYLTCFEH